MLTEMYVQTSPAVKSSSTLTWEWCSRGLVPWPAAMAQSILSLLSFLREQQNVRLAQQEGAIHAHRTYVQEIIASLTQSVAAQAALQVRHWLDAVKAAEVSCWKYVLCAIQETGKPNKRPALHRAPLEDVPSAAPDAPTLPNPVVVVPGAARSSGAEQQQGGQEDPEPARGKKKRKETAAPASCKRSRKKDAEAGAGEGAGRGGAVGMALAYLITESLTLMSVCDCDCECECVSERYR